MPTPFMHLDIAERIRQHECLAGPVQALLLDHWSAFYLGSVAADYQAISQIPREETHFYPLPPQPGCHAHEAMLDEYPQLAVATALPHEQAVFIAAYRAHLLLDLLWYWRVIVPYFIQADHWRDNRRRFLSHYLLLTYLDQQAREALPDRAAETMAAAEPANWLPFADDEELRHWRDMVAVQLQPGQPSQTIEIYAGRMGISPAEFAAHLGEPGWMDRHVFTHVPLEEMQAILQKAVDESLELITEYVRY